MTIIINSLVIINIIMVKLTQEQLNQIREFIVEDTQLHVELSRRLDIDEIKDSIDLLKQS